MEFIKDNVSDIRGAISSLKDGKLPGGGGDAHFYEDNQAPSKVKQNLASSKESEKVKGLKWLLAQLSTGKDMSDFFPDVVKNVVVKSVEVKKMVYNYLVHYADFNATCRESSLLAINSFQNDLSGSNQLIRGLALRVMTSIRLPDIIQIQLMAIRKCATDSSPYVRRCAATALPKIYVYDQTQLDSLKQIMRKLLNDNSTMVLGQAISSFNEICPTSYETIHPFLRKICHLLADFDEWSQVSALNMLTRYTRNQFLSPIHEESSGGVKITSLSLSSAQTIEKKRRVVVKKAFYSDDEDESGEEHEVDIGAEKGSVFAKAEADHNLDVDHKLIIKSSSPLLKSRNSGVVVAVCILHFYCGSQSPQSNLQIGKALVRILRNPREIQYSVLTAINTMAQSQPSLFVSFLPDFFIKSTDPIFNRILKLEILSSIATKQNIALILREMEVYAKHANKHFVSATIKAVGRIADVDPDLSIAASNGLIYLMACNKDPVVIEEVVKTLRLVLLQRPPGEESVEVLKILIKEILADEGGIEVPPARASIVWLIGEFLDPLSDVAPDILRLLAAGFSEESTEAKMQIMNLAIKMGLKSPDDENVQALSTYVLEMARYDLDTDLRDRSRFMTAMMGLAPSSENAAGEAVQVDEESLAELAEHSAGIMLSSKPAPVNQSLLEVEGMPSFTIGSLSSLVGHYVAGYECLSPWAVVQPNPATRDATPVEADDRLFSDKAVSAKKAADKDTRPFYDEESEKSSADSKSDDSESSSDSSSDDSDSDSDSDSSSSDESSVASESVESPASSSESSSDSEEEDRRALTLKPSQQQQQRLAVRKVSSGTKKPSSQATTAAGGSSTSLPFDLNLLDFTSPSPARLDSNQFLVAQEPMLSPDLMQPAQVQVMSPSFASYPIGMTSIAPASSAISSMDSPAVSTSVGQQQIQQHEQQQQQQQQQPMMQMPMMQMQMPMHMQGMPHQQQMMMMPMSMPGTMQIGMPHPGMQQMGMQMMPGGMQPVMMQSMIPSQAMYVQQPSIGALTIPVPASSPTLEFLSDPKPWLLPELCSGLSITLFYRHNVKPTAYVNACCAILSVQYHGDQVIRRVKIVLPSDIKKTSIEEIPLLTRGQEMKIPVELVLQGLEGKSYPVTVTSDRGTFNSQFAVEVVDLLMPFVVTPDEFLSARSKLTGILENTRTFDASLLSGAYTDLLSEVCNRIKRVLNTRHVQTTPTGEVYFASCNRKGMSEEKVLITVSVSGSQFTIKLNCENPTLCTTLMDILRKSFSK